MPLEPVLALKLFTSYSPKKEILNSLDAIGIIQYFDVVVSGEEVAHSKPAPDVF
ncbi:HAD hydrolase-like protein [Enterococcus sp. AZ192]|uniref:HAD hydrolase-like protein n=1 Tax=unclassified Enterococcus TaxID=2608891 RepID=UPI003D286D37